MGVRETPGDAARTKKRRRWALALALLVLLPPLLYFVVIPRTELVLRLVYNEGVLNQINIDPELRNAGTLEAERVFLRVDVVNSKDEAMGSKEYTVASLPPFGGPCRLNALSFRGDQYDTYTLVVHLRFEAFGRSFSERWSHSTSEPWMNQEWKDAVFNVF